MREKHPRKFIFFTNPHHAYLEQYFDLGVQGALLSNKLYSVLVRAIPHVFFFKDVYVQNFVAPKATVPKNRTTIHGYFQTDFFLKEMENKPQFKIRQQYVDDFRQLFGELFDNNKIIAVHIRRTDYLSYGKRDISLPIEYHKRQLEAIPDRDNCKVIFLSDDIPYVKTTFGDAPNYIYSENKDIIDFQIIQNADISIISNSSFSWWAAYLSPKKNIVIAPKNWFAFRIGREHPRGIMTDRFVWKDVL